MVTWVSSPVPWKLKLPVVRLFMVATTLHVFIKASPCNSAPVSRSVKRSVTFSPMRNIEGAKSSAVTM